MPRPGVHMLSSFGYFENPGDDLKVLENAYRSLTKDGRIVIDLRGKEIHAIENSETYSCEMPNGDLIFHRTITNDDWTGARSTWVYIKGEAAHTFRVTYALPLLGCRVESAAKPGWGW
ncbi:hypothetical protein MJD09_17345 [bacterium]|nr:hypothetical protein [bacterium]